MGMLGSSSGPEKVVKAVARSSTTLLEKMLMTCLSSFSAPQKDQSLNSFGSSQGLQKANLFFSTFPPTVPFSSVTQRFPRSLKQASKSSLGMSKLVEQNENSFRNDAQMW